GSASVRPAVTAARADMTAFSTTRLPAERAVMRKPSRIGTPDEISVPRVRVKRATATFRMSMPTIGTFNKSASITWLPWSVEEYFLKAKTNPASAARMNNKDELVDRRGELPERVGEDRATVDLVRDARRGLTQRFRVAVLAQDGETLRERQTGVDHRRELPGVDGDVLVADPAPERLGEGEGESTRFGLLLLHGGGDDTSRPELGHGRHAIGGLQLTGHRTGAGPSPIGIDRHRVLLAPRERRAAARRRWCGRLAGSPALVRQQLGQLFRNG